MFSWFPSFLAPSAAWLLALLIPLIVVYFLKLRREQVRVSSLALWRQVINDQRVNAPFQKFKRNLLLLLQILLLCLIVLAAMQPFLPGNVRNADYLPILIDCSASMRALDAQGRTRLDVAKAEIEPVINGLVSGQQLMLISVGESARRLTEFTDNKSLLLKALRDLQADDVPTRLEDGLRLCQALARTYPIERVRWYSDGNLPTRPDPASGAPAALVDIDLSLGFDFFPIPAGGPNLGITALSARREGLTRWDVFVRIESSVTGSGEAELTLHSGETEVGREPVILTAGESQRFAFRIPADQPQQLTARLQLRSPDSLAADNAAWLALPAARELQVFCAESQGTLRRALAALDGVRVSSTADPSVRWDLVISDQEADLQLGAPLSVLIGTIPEDLKDKLTFVDEGGDEIIDWRQDDSLLQYVQLRNVLLSGQIRKPGELSNAEIESLGYDLLAFGSAAPVILKKRERSRSTLFILFPLERSTLPYRVGFPVLISNLVREAVQLAEIGEIESIPTGILPPIPAQPGQAIVVRGPEGREQTARTDDEGLVTGVVAAQAGEYQVQFAGQTLESVGASLLNASETSLAAVDKIQFKEQSVSAETERVVEDRPLWPAFAWAALGLLLLEWWYFQRAPAERM